jgi:hypothetical protein
MFQLGGAEPTEKAREIMTSVAEVIRDQDAKIAIEGHTDAAPFRGDQITNWELSTNRASAARRMLETNGLDPSRVARVVGYADTELLIKDQPKDGPPLAEGLKKELRASFPQQTKPGTSDPAAEAASDRESTMRQSFLEKKAAMKKTRRDAIGLWD